MENMSLCGLLTASDSRSWYDSSWL